MPQELADQMPVLKELLGYLGYPMVSREGYEADDILGTLSAAWGAAAGRLPAGHRRPDSLQLVSETATVLLTPPAWAAVKRWSWTWAAVREKYGVEPKQLIQVKS